MYNGITRRNERNRGERNIQLKRKGAERERERDYHIEGPLLIVVDLRIEELFEVSNRNHRVGH